MLANATHNISKVNNDKNDSLNTTMEIQETKKDELKIKDDESGPRAT